MTSIGLSVIGKSIKSRAKFNISELNTQKLVKKIKIPALFVHGKDDEFILPEHSTRLVKEYGGPVRVMYVEGDHNTPRP